jgi:hypothetical protein
MSGTSVFVAPDHGRGSFLAPSEAGNSSRALGLLRDAAKGVK